MVGKYERGDAMPSIEVVKKIVDPLDYLVGNSDLEVDATTLNRVLELPKLPNELREKLYYFIDMSIRDFKAKQAYS